MKTKSGSSSPCGIIKEIRKEIADSVHFAELSQKTYPGTYRRASAKAISRANDLIEKKACGGIRIPKKIEKIQNKFLGLIPKLFVGGDRVDPKTLNKMKSILSDLDRMKRGTC